jgi:hypothetical protein
VLPLLMALLGPGPATAQMAPTPAAPPDGQLAAGGATMPFHGNSLADSGACPLSAGLIVADQYDGEVRRAAALEDYFAGPLDASRWDWGSWNGATYSPVPTGGALAVQSPGGSAWLRSRPALGPATLTGRVSLGRGPWQHVGWGAEGFGDRWAILSTGSTGDGVWARTFDGATESWTALPGVTLDAYHDLRIAWRVDRVDYSVDGVLVANHALAVPGPMYVYGSSNSDGGALWLDRLRVETYQPGASTYVSTVKDGGAPNRWHSMVWQADVPPGTGLSIQTRTSADGVTWTGWSAVGGNGGSIANSYGRHLQYRAMLTSSATESPRLEAVIYGIASTPLPITTPTVSPDGHTIYGRGRRRLRPGRDEDADAVPVRGRGDRAGRLRDHHADLHADRDGERHSDADPEPDPHRHADADPDQSTRAGDDRRAGRPGRAAAAGRAGRVVLRLGGAHRAVPQLDHDRRAGRPNDPADGQLQLRVDAELPVPLRGRGVPARRRAGALVLVGRRVLPARHEPQRDAHLHGRARARDQRDADRDPDRDRDRDPDADQDTLPDGYADRLAGRERGPARVAGRIPARVGGQPSMIQRGHASNAAGMSPDDVCLEPRNAPVDGDDNQTVLLYARA